MDGIAEDGANLNNHHVILLDGLEELPEEIGDEIDEVLVALVLREGFPLAEQGSEEIES